ncbi:MAG: 30S ribosomal protein S6 [Myxococcota bacterium]
MLSHEYETIIIVRPDIEDAAVFGIAEKVEQIVLGNAGHLLDREDWGKRKLSYPIAKHQRGHYLRLNYLCPAPLISEIERRIRNEDQVVRFMTVRLADAVDVPTRIEQAAVQRARREEEMKRRAAEAALGIGDDDDDFDDDDDDDDIGGDRAERT